ncbi:MAG: septum formation inhibitor Maf [Xanthomonadales bacterium]|nr:septum formation inhibitor Maf [Xanthomonadales bacterium]
MTLFLASQSPRRRELLNQIGVVFEPLEVGVDETPAGGESPLDYVRRVAREKAGAGLLQVAAVPGALVLGADTEVVLDGLVFGKPADAADAARMLRLLSGRTHQVISAVALVSAGREVESVSVSEVRFAMIDEPAIAAYIATGEPFGKAGAYAIQGRGATLVAHLSGSFSGVMGLPVHETAVLLRGFGFAV